MLGRDGGPETVFPPRLSKASGPQARHIEGGAKIHQFLREMLSKGAITAAERCALQPRPPLKASLRPLLVASPIRPHLCMARPGW